MSEAQESRNTVGAAVSVDFSSPDGWLRSLVEHTMAGIYLIQDGRFRYVNQGFADIFGYDSPADIIDVVGIEEFVVPEDRRRVADNVRRRVTGEEPEMRYSFIGLRRDGRRIHVEVHGRAMEFKGRPAVIGMLLDITARKLSEAASDEKLRALFEHSLLGIALIDTHGRHVEFNDTYLRLLGYPAETLRTLSVKTLVPDRFAHVFDEAKRSIEHVGCYGPIELEYRRHDGQLIPIQASGVMITGCDGERYLWSIVEDISVRKRLENEMAEHIEKLNVLNKKLADTQNQLLQAEKMSAVGQLAAGVAHEINNPVGFVSSNLGSLQKYLNQLLELIDIYEKAEPDCPINHPAVKQAREMKDIIDFQYLREDVLKLLQESLEGTERVKRIVADLKDFSRVGEADWQNTDVHRCLDSTLNVVANELKYKATIVKEYGEVPNIRGMPFQLNQVFMNLLVNAAHAIADQGTITIRTGLTDGDVWIEIEDTGIGIPPENLKQIFDPFFTTKPVGKGTGLGLSVSFGIVQKHHGRIEVKSTPGTGTVFRVTLPIDPTKLPEGQTSGQNSEEEQSPVSP